MITIEILNQILNQYFSGVIQEKNEIKALLIEKGLNETEIVQLLQITCEKKNNDDLASIFFAIALTRIYSDLYFPILRKLLIEIWHKCHEEIMLILQFKMRDPNCVNDVAEAMHIKFDYMLDDGDAFIRKGAYVLATLKTDDAIQKLNELANDENEIIKKYATYQLRKLRGEDVDEEEDDD